MRIASERGGDERIIGFSVSVPLPGQYRRMQDGDTLTIGNHQWRCISGFGHAPEHIALYCEASRLLIGGDMMLPRISTNVSVYEQEPEADALTLFLSSIDRFLPLTCPVNFGPVEA